MKIMDKNTHVKKLISRFKLDCSINTRKFHHGHEYVDLGLPSRTLWATCNVGAESETDFGNYYKYGSGSNVYIESFKSYDGMENPLDPIVDTATQVWGGRWHTPTLEQMQELINKTKHQWVADYKGSGVRGVLFASKENGNSVFFPACGHKYMGQVSDCFQCHYWTSSNLDYNPYELIFGLDCIGIYRFFRYCGLSVRGVFSRSS